MRKITKSRVDDDGISSTNGSISNEIGEQPETDQPSIDKIVAEDETDAEVEAEENGDKDDDLIDKKSKKKGGKTSKKIKLKKKSDDDEGSDGEADAKDNCDDDINNPTATPLKKSKKKGGKKAKKSKSSTKSKDIEEDHENNGEEEYEVEKVVDSKKIKGKLHYLIRWKGYSASSDTWEPEDTLSCPELINKFVEKNGSVKESSSARKRKGKPVKETPAKKSKSNSEWDGENADENAEYEVEKILEVHHKKDGKREFLIHWKGWSSKFDSWEPENHLNCTDLIKKFMDKVSAARTSDSKTLRVNPESTKRFTLQAPSSGRRLSKRRGQKQRIRYDNAE